MKTSSAASPNPGSTAPEKFTWLLDRYFRLDRDDTLIERLKSLFETDAEGHLTPTPLLDPLTGETRGLMVLGNSGTGKSALIMRTLRALPVFDLAGREQDGNTLYVTVPPEATIKSLAGRIAKDLGYVDINPRARAYEAWDVARHRMRERGIRLLVIDEMHHLLRKGSGRDVEGGADAEEPATGRPAGRRYRCGGTQAARRDHDRSGNRPAISEVRAVPARRGLKGSSHFRPQHAALRGEDRPFAAH